MHGEGAMHVRAAPFAALCRPSLRTDAGSAALEDVTPISGANVAAPAAAAAAAAAAQVEDPTAQRQPQQQPPVADGVPLFPLSTGVQPAAVRTVEEPTGVPAYTMPFLALLAALLLMGVRYLRQKQRRRRPPFEIPE